MILIATGNAHKLGEFQRLLPGIELTSLRDHPDAPDPVEDAPDFAGNAMIKARAAHARTGKIALADDSGLEVEALDWGPGIYSARYAPGTDVDRVAKLLEELKGASTRRARFTCVIAVCGVPAEIELPEGLRREGDCVLAEGQVYGEIAEAPSGGGGFGYDPVFLVAMNPTTARSESVGEANPQSSASSAERRIHGQTIAELSADEKHAISHRGRAARAIYPFLKRIIEDS